MDPAAWGSDHVGRTFPEYVTGDECLFCHRTIGATWNDNRHQLTIRAATPDDPALAALKQLAEPLDASAQPELLLGTRHATRYLRRSDAYGKLDLLSTSFDPPTRGLRNTDSVQWNATEFGVRCAGCHTTAVDARSKAFSALSLDCVTCHGVVDLAHSKDASRVFLSKQHRDPHQVTSTCGQCHLRGGKSKSSGLPYPNTFVAGDNLFRDFAVNSSEAAIRTHAAIDQHIFWNAREVALLNRTEMTCLTCHDVHAGSTDKHRELTHHAVCGTCHVSVKDYSQLRDSLLPGGRREHSRTCDYDNSGANP